MKLNRTAVEYGNCLVARFHIETRRGRASFCLPRAGYPRGCSRRTWRAQFFEEGLTQPIAADAPAIGPQYDEICWIVDSDKDEDPPPQRNLQGQRQPNAYNERADGRDILGFRVLRVQFPVLHGLIVNGHATDGTRAIGLRADSQCSPREPGLHDRLWNRRQAVRAHVVRPDCA